MSILTTLGKGQGFVKAGFLGMNKSGKTRTAIELAIGIRKYFGLKGPIAMFDTEGGAEYVAPRVRKETGLELIGVRSRSLKDLLQTGRDCEKEGISVLVPDSITHPWRELCDSYLASVNQTRAKKNLPPRYKLEFQDWAIVKGMWEPWTQFYINSKLHIIVCGRAGFDYDFEQNEETGRKELIKTGVKMKTEGEFGFEPSLLVEMERVQDLSGDTTKMLHRATIIGDRFGVIDGKYADDPTFEFFKPHVEQLKPGAHAPIDVQSRTVESFDDSGDGEWIQERKWRTIFCEEIQGVMLSVWPGQTGEEKRAKADLLEEVFQTRSWTAVENMQSERLKAGLEKIRTMLNRPRPQAAPPAEAQPTAEAQATPAKAKRERKPKSNGAPELITPRELRVLTVLSSDAGWTHAELDAMLKKRGIAALDQIPSDRFDEICQVIEAGDEPKPETQPATQGAMPWQ